VHAEIAGDDLNPWLCVWFGDPKVSVTEIADGQIPLNSLTWGNY
jgi:hypothetical protein